MAGKNKIETGFRILWNTQDLSGDLIAGSLNGGGVVLDQVEMTGVSNTIRNYLRGHGSAPVTARFHMNDTATSGAFTALNAATQATLTLQYGSAGVAPTAGDPEWEGVYVHFGFQPVVDAGRFVMEVTFQPAAGQTAPAWGVYA
jgi:hypothetical protein